MKKIFLLATLLPIAQTALINGMSLETSQGPKIDLLFPPPKILDTLISCAWHQIDNQPTQEVGDLSFDLTFENGSATIPIIFDTTPKKQSSIKTMPIDIPRNNRLAAFLIAHNSV